MRSMAEKVQNLNLLHTASLPTIEAAEVMLNVVIPMAEIWPIKN